MKRTLAATALVVIFTLALAAPAFSQDMSYEATMKFDGDISFSMQAGHWCNTGAEMQQRISGQGSLEKALEVYMEEGMIAVDDANSWVTSPTAIRNLTVTTAIWLCAPPKYEYNDGDGWAVAPFWNYNEDGVFDPALGGLYADADESEFRAVSDQVWAVQVAANPGFSGQIDMAFEAANSNKLSEAALGAGNAQRHDAAWLRGAPFAEDWPGYRPWSVGPWFPGSYFNIEQYSRTSSGTHRRHIDISSPYSHAYLSETMTVVGMSEVWEAFSMENLPAGNEVGALWWALF